MEEFSFIKMKKKNVWQMFIEYQRKKNPDKSLKEILKNYDKELYAKFKKNPSEFI